MERQVLTCANNESKSKPSQKTTVAIGSAMFNIDNILTKDPQLKFRRAGYSRCKKLPGQLYGALYTTQNRPVFVVSAPSSMPSSVTIKRTWKQEIEKGHELTVYWPKYRLKFFPSELQSFFGNDSEFQKLYAAGDPGNGFNPSVHWFTEDTAKNPQASADMNAWINFVYTPAARKANKTKVKVHLGMLPALVFYTEDSQARKGKPERTRTGGVGRAVALDEIIHKYFAKQQDLRIALGPQFHSSNLYKKHAKALEDERNHVISKRSKSGKLFKAPKPFVAFGTGSAPDNKRYLLNISTMTDNSTPKGIKIDYHKNGAQVQVMGRDKDGTERPVEVFTTYAQAYQIFLDFYAPYAERERFNFFTSAGLNTKEQIRDVLRDKAVVAAQRTNSILNPGLYVRLPKGTKRAGSPRSTASPTLNPMTNEFVYGTGVSGQSFVQPVQPGNFRMGSPGSTRVSTSPYGAPSYAQQPQQYGNQPAPSRNFGMGQAQQAPPQFVQQSQFGQGQSQQAASSSYNPYAASSSNTSPRPNASELFGTL